MVDGSLGGACEDWAALPDAHSKTQIAGLAAGARASCAVGSAAQGLKRSCSLSGSAFAEQRRDSAAGHGGLFARKMSHGNVLSRTNTSPHLQGVTTPQRCQARRGSLSAMLRMSAPTADGGGGAYRVAEGRAGGGGGRRAAGGRTARVVAPEQARDSLPEVVGEEVASDGDDDDDAEMPPVDV